jgi:hypothetical protein
MKSRMTIILALLLVLSAGLAEPSHAAQSDVLQSMQLDDSARKITCPLADDSGPGETGDTLGDPDGWLGGQNFRPSPPITTDGLEQALPSPGGFIASLLALIQLFMIL